MNMIDDPNKKQNTKLRTLSGNIVCVRMHCKNQNKWTWNVQNIIFRKYTRTHRRKMCKTKTTHSGQGKWTKFKSVSLLITFSQWTDGWFPKSVDLWIDAISIVFFPYKWQNPIPIKGNGIQIPITKFSSNIVYSFRKCVYIHIVLNRFSGQYVFFSICTCSGAKMRNYKNECTDILTSFFLSHTHKKIFLNLKRSIQYNRHVIILKMWHWIFNWLLSSGQGRKKEMILWGAQIKIRFPFQNVCWMNQW